MKIEPYISKGELKSEDVYVLCSDGVTDVMDLSDIYEILCNFDAEQAVSHILSEVKQRNGTDNATVIVIKIA